MIVIPEGVCRMENIKREEAQTTVLEDAPDYYIELSEYLEVLSNSQRLKILKILEAKPRDVRSIASEISTSYENTKKHLDKLISMGLIKKEVGLGQQTSKGVHPVWKYSLVPGAMEAIVRNLGIFSNMKINPVNPELHKRLDDVRGQVAEELAGITPMVVVLGGPDDGKYFLLTDPRMNIGRIDPGQPGRSSEHNVILSTDYAAVSRVSKPHGKFIMENNEWYIEDSGSTGGTFVNAHPVTRHTRAILHDGDLIELSRGPTGAKLLIILPAEEQKDRS
jgi:DNA-binding transcriptional ArsR family regulator